MNQFKLHSESQPTGDQPQAIAELVKGFQEGNQFETLFRCDWFEKNIYDGEYDS